MNDADVKRAVQQARRINTAAAWRDLASDLRRNGFVKQARQAQDKADELKLEELEKKEGRQ